MLKPKSWPSMPKWLEYEDRLTRSMEGEWNAPLKKGDFLVWEMISKRERWQAATIVLGAAAVSLALLFLFTLGGEFIVLGISSLGSYLEQSPDFHPVPWVQRMYSWANSKAEIDWSSIGRFFSYAAFSTCGAWMANRMKLLYHREGVLITEEMLEERSNSSS